MTERRLAAVVTGGGGGIGTAVALELARRGVAVVAMDNGVSVQGEPVNEPTAARTAELIEAEGGVARASSASVTDRAAVRALFAGVVAEFGALDIVVNTAGILRYPPFLDASEQDWRDVLDVHLNGYLNVLSEAVPLMVAAGYGRIVGVTSGAGTVRAAGDAAAYACAKRAVAAVTWQLAGLLPEDVALNALSPLAATRMTTRAVTRGDTARAAGGLDLSGLPPARDMAPLAAFLASQEVGSCRGRVIFSAGPELSVVSPPRILEAVRTQHTADFAASLDTLVPVVLGPAEAGQRSTGGANARFGPVFDQPGTPGPVPGPNPANCLVITGSAPLAASATAALVRCGLTAIDLSGRPLTTPSGQASQSGPSPSRQPVPLPVGFSAAEAAVERAAQAAGGIDAVIIAPGPFAASGPAVPSWQEMMTGYAATAGHVLSHAGWLQAVARHAVRTSRPVRVMHLADATSPPLRATAQAVAQLARCATLLRPGLVDVFSIALETAEPADHEPVAHLTARLLWAGDAAALRGAELVARPGWIGLRSHPAPAATASYGTSALPSWIPDWLRESV
ncbi:MAG TPA: SDR family NAD(P)-dependent oxidoreductase [Streptosporangiaceae bacterium]|nr:SDR family NAD(P)-dependent oxidoreductase [Streptosporangiaceae bacterium]